MCHDKTAVASGIEGWHCPICGECEFANEADSRRHMDTLSALIANVKSSCYNIRQGKKRIETNL